MSTTSDQVRGVLLLTGSGEVVAERGLTPATDVQALGALAAAVLAAAHAMATAAGATPPLHVHLAAPQGQTLLFPLPDGERDLVLVAVCDAGLPVERARQACDRLAHALRAGPAP